ncbi:uncharacterized protein K452DRAFT_322659 [Aplosporella prunicola CBS 121167]|uniref:HAT C-terminal dimerisation domain-containing protein n=1 Tax=Aplosporella prunicola CBS 121167 TaxID=1176127 RepID=A0A6A6B042_9PEZI|nr:uncharacterized protein K452DRAFT_322659 [Aplosporella prunicola CBS 121167]KAF2136071.1 hypothetical protein K452DRAFT_322659 [Aplosporella prunicola CBS 121167]
MGLWDDYKEPATVTAPVPQETQQTANTHWHDEQWAEDTAHYIFGDEGEEQFDELQRYLHEPYLKEKTHQLDVLQWWVIRREQYPTLSRMAIDLLACPAMSSDCERSFSAAGRSISKLCSRLTEGTAEAIACLHSWLPAGWVRTEDWMARGINVEDE